MKKEWRWRKESQTAQGRKAMKWVSRALSIAGIVCFICVIWLRMSRSWAMACLAVTTISLVLYVVFPQYLTLIGAKQLRKMGCKAEVNRIGMGVLFPCLALTIASIKDFSVLSWVPLLAIVVLLGAVVSLAVWRESKEMRLCTASVRVELLIMALLACFGVVMWGNHLLNFDTAAPQAYVVAALKRYNGSRGIDSYNCVIELAPGERVYLPIGVSVYRELEPGDTVQAYIGRGALGIRYAYYVGETP